MIKVLLVEDNPTLLDSMAFNLEMHGYDIIQATDGEQAITTLKGLVEPPDVIVSDIAMPNMNGYQLLEAVHSESLWNTVPFIFLTAFDSRNAVQLGKELGADDYLVKPFDPEELVTAIENKLKMVTRFRADAANRLDQMRKDLIMMISHEIRTPLTSIYGGANVLAKNMDQMSPETVRTVLEIVTSGATRLNNLVTQIVFLLRYDCGQAQDVVKKSSKPLAVKALLTKAMEPFFWEVGDPDGSDERLLTSGVEQNAFIRVNGISDYLVLALSEIIRNALAYSPKTQPINIKVEANDTHVSFIVEDQGGGIAPEQLHRVWERFVQIDREEHEQQGAGLGLTIVRACANLHGGSCAIDSSEDGTRVTFTLPIYNVE